AGLLQTGKDDAPLRLDPRDWGETVMSEERELHATGLVAMGARELAGTPFDVPVLRQLAPPFHQGPFWTDVSLWDGAVRALLPTIGAVVTRDLAEAERADLVKSRALLQEALPISPQDASTLFSLGLVEWLLGDDDGRACQHLRDAARYDHAPTRGTDVDNGIVRELAAAHPEALFVDTEEFVRAACPGGLITYELLMDNCHFYSGARGQVMDRFIRGFLELGSRAKR
ncbi:MAG TPA: hypothetical protein VK824_12695, partial [Planctomycetota bacterium]|nr:hypothetical protein [Planctomycetota bacterium]